MSSFVEGYAGPTVQVDAAMKLEDAYLPEDIGAASADAVTTLLRLSRFPSGQMDWVEYRERFVDRWGADGLVSLLDLLDPVAGLGPPQPAKEAPTVAERHNLLLRLGGTALRDDSEEVELTDELVDALSTSDLRRDRLPSSLDLVGTIVADSVAAMRQGEWKFVVSPGLGGLAGGKHLGRFADLLGSDCEEILSEIANGELACAPHQLAVELKYPPIKPTHLNICSRSSGRPFFVAYGVPPNGSDERRILLSEVTVSLRGTDFNVRWEREDIEIRPAGWHMYNPQLAPEPIRFLFNAHQGGNPVLTSFAWGAASQLPRTPRVVRGRVVFCPQRWRVAGSDKLVYLARSEKEWETELHAWRQKWSVPRRVLLGEGDKRLLLDLDCDSDVQELRRYSQQIARTSRIILSEALGLSSHGWLQGPGGNHLCEIAVPLLRRSTSPWVTPKKPLRWNNHRHPCEKPLGSDWVYVDIYAPPYQHEVVIAGPLRRFANDLVKNAVIHRWYYLRYVQSSRHHIRFRVHGDPSKLISAIPSISTFLQHLTDGEWISDFQYRTYRREIMRYGGPDSVDRVERIFAIDSEFCSEVLDVLLSRQPRIDRKAIVAWTMQRLITGLTISDSGWTAVFGHSDARGQESGRVFRQESRFLRHAFSGELPAWAQGLASSAAIASARIANEANEIRQMQVNAVGHKSLEALASSIVHMHCNRLLGIDRVSETVVQQICLRTLKSLHHSPITR